MQTFIRSLRVSLRRPMLALASLAVLGSASLALPTIAGGAPLSVRNAVLVDAAPSAMHAASSDVAKWSDGIWEAAKSGDMHSVEKALEAVPDSQAAAAAERLRAYIETRAKHVDEGSKTRDADRAKAMDEMKAELEKGDVTKALTAAVRVQTLSDDMATALEIPEVKSVIARAETAQEDARKASDWLLAQELLYRLRVLYQDSGNAETFRRYDGLLDELNKRVSMLAQYAPREFWRMRSDYAKRVDPTNPLPEFNDAFAEDWREPLDGISKGILTTALTNAANDHISSGGWEPLVIGGLEAVRVLATTPALRENFPNLADPEKAKFLVEAAEKQLETVRALDRTKVGKPVYNAALRDVLAANLAGPQLPDAVIFREFGDGALEELSDRFEDEYTQLIWPDQIRRFQQMIKGDFVGVGVQIRHDERRDIQVVAPIEGSPAWRAGVRGEDRIIEVDGEPTVGWPLNKAVDTITGPAGQPVTLTLRREGEAEPVKVELVREKVDLPSVNGWWKKALDTNSDAVWDWYISPDAGIGYVRLTQFSEDSFTDFMKAVRAMRNERGLNGLILDLRYNPGGTLRGAIDFSNAFIERGGIVAGEDRDHRRVFEQRAEPGRAVLKDLPLVVLVNQGSASASEIVSGALKANDRAVIIGERTFGKGSVQEVRDCSDGRANAQIKLTTQYYVIPPGPGELQGRLVHKKPGATDWGIVPDLEVKATPEQIEKALNLRREADTIEPWKEASAENKRPDIQDLVTKGVDPQLELALLILEAKALKQFDAAAAQAAATDAEPSPEGAKGAVSGG
ncbi:MAG: S41 family peptidase [Limnohabitans sp.]|jgi:carboxyl-terminal processing protease|nr:S41 family peptidase [Limnohabitans sp.]